MTTFGTTNHGVSLIDSLKQFRDLRFLRIFLLGISSGMPALLIGSALNAWLQDLGLTRSAIGFFGSVFAVYAFNFLWAPIVDKVRLPFLGRLGRRRSWIVLCQALLVVFSGLFFVFGPHVSLIAAALLALLVAIASATQDLAIDAYRITIIREDEPHLIGHAAAITTCGWWTGASGAGAIAFYVTDMVGWPSIYLGLAGVFVLLALVVVFAVKEPILQLAVDKSQVQSNTFAFNIANVVLWIGDTFVEPLVEFFRRNSVQLALGLLLFIFLFKIGEAFLGRMVIVFYKEVGFTNAEIGTYAKGYGLLVTLVCSIAAGVFMGRFGPVRGLLYAGIAMASTNLLFSWIAVSGPDTRLLVLAVAADNITSSFSTVAFVAFISYFTSRLHTATQYGLLASLGTLSRTLLAASSGVMVDALGGNWSIFFIITALMVTPSLVILALVSRRIRKSQPLQVEDVNHDVASKGSSS